MDTKQLHRIFSHAVYVMVGVALAFSTMGSAFAQDVDLKVGLVFTETGLTDNSFNWMAYQGLLQAQTDLGVTISDYTPASSEEYGAVLQQCADDGNGLCIAVGFSYGDSLANVATSNPDTKWAIVDWSYDYEIPNARGLRFNEKQAGYLAGVLAGDMTSSNVVGAVGGMEIPPVVAFLEGYRNGAQCTNPDVNVLAT
jgi:basic membrane protein A